MAELTTKVADHYTVRYEFDGQHWVVELEEIPQVHTFARTLAKADANIRDALALWLDVPNPDALKIVPDLRLDPAAVDVVSRANRARFEAHERTQEAAKLAREAALVLVDKLHVSLRDAGFLLGVSHQRVAQLLDDAKR